MSATNITKLKRLPDTVWNEVGHTEDAHLARHLLLQPDILSPMITNLQGQESQKFPLSALTEGVGNVKSLTSIEFKYPVMGKINKAVPLAKAVSGATPGIAGTEFEMVFTEKHFPRQYKIRSPKGYTMRIQSDGKPVAGGYSYQVVLASTSQTAYLPASECAAGTLYVKMFAPVAPSGSRGNESNWAAPGDMTNQLTTIRKSYRYEGNVQNTVVNIQVQVNGRTTNLWYDFIEWQYMQQWQEECEMLYWYGEYNRDANGKIHIKDDNGMDIPEGSGVLEQIPNRDTYASLTENKLSSVVQDATFGASDSRDMNIELWGGTGARQEFDKAMKGAVNAGSWTIINDKSVTGAPGSANLAYGAYFTQYRSINGNVITFRYNPVFDYGPVALNCPRHPKTGLPIESYKMVFLDRSTYDGEPNVQFVTLKGREMLRWAVAGATIPNGFSGNALRASDIDGGSVHFLKTGGINIRRATNCLLLECSLS